jgi:hypothetical protein
MILASHGLIASQIASFDADALAFFQRVSDATGTLSLTEKQAVNQLVLDLKANSLWTPMKAIYPMVGASAAACKQNLKSSSFTGTFTSGWTFASTGVKGNGTSAYMNTGLTMTSAESIDFAYGGYIRTNVSNLYGVITGARSGGNEFNLAGKWTAVNDYPYVNMGNGSSWIYGTSVVNAGFFQGSRSAVNNLSFRRNNASLGTNTVAITAQANTASFYIGTLNDAGNIISVCCISDEISLVYYSSSLTNANMDNFYTAVQAFQTTLSRQV